MDDISRRVLMSRLMDLYGAMLSDRISEIMILYLTEDLGLSEIAADLGISRQGVYDAIKRGEAQLLELEEKLHINARLQAIENELTQCEELLILPDFAHCESIDAAIQHIEIIKQYI